MAWLLTREQPPVGVTENNLDRKRVWASGRVENGLWTWTEGWGVPAHRRAISDRASSGAGAEPSSVCSRQPARGRCSLSQMTTLRLTEWGLAQVPQLGETLGPEPTFHHMTVPSLAPLGSQQSG